MIMVLFGILVSGLLMVVVFTVISMTSVNSWPSRVGLSGMRAASVM
jgi:hypothetical protein